jgi:hypothetical protein
MRTFAIVLYYFAIFVLILFVGVVGYKLLFGTPCTIVGNYCVGDGWSIAGLAATVLGILGAFALAAWWTDLDGKVREQVNVNMKHREEALNKRTDEILAKLATNINKDILDLFTSFSERITQDFSESEHVVKTLDTEIKTLRIEYEDIKKMADNARKLAVDIATLGNQSNDEWVLSNAANQYHMVDIAVNMVTKYLIYIDIYLFADESEKENFLLFLKTSGVNYTDLHQIWERVLFWQKQVNNFSTEHPDIVKQINDKVESYQKRLDEAEQADVHEM